ncbi:hypothetical protein PP175_21900 [Aneurinibacillus sp. Ricciae_BoGa-3]|uniref:anti-sigma-I factor RsgI family protein n=1 Tax=Aneurinibacillus sp. Ricciae_BoGa-3 TaxID=3022697 RepID=UPI002340C91E|nr:hypothetical protein [Aneurinibacillus sp. Ricciae_BoGa-3]WCK53945.1 hypothetical protein PP175_21900 [Aneurinibacillus sp. Ricciae_BoGa-3]
MMKGVVLKTGKHHLTVMAAGGEFYKVHAVNGSKREGDTIEFFAEQIVQGPRPLKRTAAIHSKSFLTVAAVVLLLLFSIPMWNRAEPVSAAVSIDINPSVQLEVDSRDRVMAATGENADGSSLLASIDWKNRPILEVTDLIINQAQREGYLTKGTHDILIVPVAVADNKDAASIKKLFQLSLPGLAAKLGDGTTITFMEGNKEEREQAGREKISIGKYKLYELAKQKKINMSSRQMAQLSISEISSRLGGISAITGALQYTGKQEASPALNQKKASQQHKRTATTKPLEHVPVKTPHLVKPEPSAISPHPIQASDGAAVKPVHNAHVHPLQGAKETMPGKKQEERNSREPQEHSSGKIQHGRGKGEGRQKNGHLQSEHPQNDHEQRHHEQTDTQQNRHHD